MATNQDTDDSGPNGTPPSGHDWGERTQQSRKHAPKFWETDAYEIRQRFGIPKFDVSGFAFDADADTIASPVFPDVILHEKSATPPLEANKGTDVLFIGDRDAGKTTCARHFAARLMDDDTGVVGVDDLQERMDEPVAEPDIPAERVIWRGSSERSGWLPYRNWTTLYLPANADIDARWMNEDDVPVEGADLEDVVRDVVYYDDVLDLLETLGERPAGTFNVVYPDPSFSGCEELTRETNRIGMTLPFTPAWETDAGESATPNSHWWFAFLLARAEHGPFVWMSLIFDEANDLFPENASDSDSYLAKKVELLRSIWASSRKRLMSFYFFAHQEETIHSKIRREFKWRVQMPDGSENPKRSRKSTIPLGFSRVPMWHDLMSWRDPGVGLCYSQSQMSYFGWENIQPEGKDQNRWLNISLGEPDELPTATEPSTSEATLEFDDKVFHEWQNSTHHRLYVNDPGEGFVDVDEARVEEPLSSPIEGLAFCEGLREGQDHREVRMTDGEQDIVVARVPSDSDRSSGGSVGVGVGP